MKHCDEPHGTVLVRRAIIRGIRRGLTSFWTEAEMAHVYFHYSSADEVIIDRRGAEVFDLMEARERALSMAQSIMAHAWGIANFRDWFVHVTDEEDDELLMVPFVSAMATLH